MLTDVYVQSPSTIRRPVSPPSHAELIRQCGVSLPIGQQNMLVATTAVGAECRCSHNAARSCSGATYV